MVTKGAFGYIIGKKKRLMIVNDDADLLWQILVREIYVLMNHYKTKEELQQAFEKIELAKNKPNPTQSPSTEGSQGTGDIKTQHQEAQQKDNNEYSLGNACKSNKKELDGISKAIKN